MNLHDMNYEEHNVWWYDNGHNKYVIKIEKIGKQGKQNIYQVLLFRNELLDSRVTSIVGKKATFCYARIMASQVTP